MKISTVHVSVSKINVFLLNRTIDVSLCILLNNFIKNNLHLYNQPPSTTLIFYSYTLPVFTTIVQTSKVCTMFTVTIEANPCESIVLSAILTTFFFHKLPRFRKIQCADLNGINLPTRNTGTLRGKMQLLAIAICQIENGWA